MNGMIQSAAWPALISIVSNWHGKNYRGTIMSIWVSCAATGRILGAYIVSILTQSLHLPWYWAYAFFSALFVFQLLLNWCLLIEDPASVGIEILETSEPLPTALNDDGNDARLSDDDEGPLIPVNLQDQHATRFIGSTARATDRSADYIEVSDDETTLPELQTNATNPQSTGIRFMDAVWSPGVMECSLTFFGIKFSFLGIVNWLPIYLS